MNRKQAKEFYPIMQAFAEGRVIECRTRTWELNKGWQYSTTWKETEELKFQDTYEYRVKPEQKYRPFKDAEECWAEMQKHYLSIWVKLKDTESGYYILKGIASQVIIGFNETPFSYKKAFEDYTFTDGTPFGVKVEEE